MGLRQLVKKRLQGLTDRLSGEHSAAAPDPESVEGYSRPGTPNEDAEVVMARLKRPRVGTTPSGASDKDD